ncbi:MAG TPA: MqnA/MqnD/SBP family protein [Planctomycetota bacterium]|nr:MqnA/MqnD/SBP family protein [Planctomycetota bacterium]
MLDRAVRFGAVSYLNARPLIEGLHPLVLATPAELAKRQARGEVDVALLPVAAGEAMGLPRVGRLGIAAEGPVDSVLLFLRRGIRDVRTVALDPASRTSRALTRLLLEEELGLSPRYVEPPADAELLIGDAALVRGATDEPRLDLAAEWTRRTGLPFVFAAWYGDPGAGPELEAAHERGQRQIARYAREAALGLPAGAMERYLRERIRFRIGPREEEGLARFLARGRARGLL